MIFISLLIQDTHLDRTSLKKFVYLMIDAIERLNNTREFDRISDKESSLESLNDLITHQVDKVYSIKRIDDKESSWIAWELNQSIESTIKNVHWLLKSYLNQQTKDFLFWRLNTINMISFSAVEHCSSFNQLTHHDLIICERLLWRILKLLLWDSWFYHLWSRYWISYWLWAILMHSRLS